MNGRRYLTGFFRRMRNLPAGFRKFRYWILAGIFLIFLVAVAPWVGLLERVLAALWHIFRPILDNRWGRLALLNVILVLVVVIVWKRFRARGRRLLGAFALDRFLSGLLNLSGGRYRKAVRRFETVLRVGRWVDLSRAVDAYPEIAEDARIKSALCYRELGDVPRAMRCLETIRVRELSASMRKELAEAKAFVYSLSDELMDETVDREIAAALDLDPQNRRLLRLRRDRAERSGDLPAAIEAERRLVKLASAVEKPLERSRLAVLHARFALRHYRDGRVEEALAEVSRSRSSDATLVLPNLLSGDIAVDRGDVRGAVREWSRTPSLPCLERIRGLLEDGKLSTEQDHGFLVSAFPRAGVLLALGEHYLSLGKLRRARNCVGQFEALGLADRHSAHIMAEIHRQEGDLAGAERLEWRALKGFLGGDRVQRG